MKRAVTLIEILVVVAILAAFFSPTSAQATLAARKPDRVYRFKPVGSGDLAIHRSRLHTLRFAKTKHDIRIASGLAPAPTAALKEDLDSVCSKFHGKLGYYVKNLKTGEWIGNRQDEQFPSASTIKTAIMLETVKQIEEGRLHWTDKLSIPPFSQRSKSMWTAFLRDDVSVNIDGLVNLMMNFSDNTAAVMLADMVDVNNIERRMNALGFKDTACTIRAPVTNRRLRGVWDRFANMGVTTPHDMGRLLELIYRRKAASPAACDRMLRIMSHQYWDDYFMSQIPPGTYVCSKVGALERSRSDTAIVFGPTPYIVVAYTDDDKDRGWAVNCEAHVALRRISHEVWKALNPETPYDPPKDAPNWYPTGAGVEDS